MTHLRKLGADVAFLQEMHLKNPAHKQLFKNCKNDPELFKISKYNRYLEIFKPSSEKNKYFFSQPHNSYSRIDYFFLVLCSQTKSRDGGMCNKIKSGDVCVCACQLRGSTQPQCGYKKPLYNLVQG